MAFADPDRVRRILAGAGFADIDLESLETTLPLGPDVPAAVEKLCQFGPTGRLLEDATEDLKARVADDLGAVLAEYQTEDGVRMGCAIWIVTATAS
jgi:hypothetical protein